MATNSVVVMAFLPTPRQGSEQVMYRDKLFFRFIVLIGLVLLSAFSVAAQATDLNVNKVQSTSFAPSETGQYTFTLNSTKPLDLPAGLEVQVDFPKGYNLVQGDLLAANPGCSLASLQYKEEKDRFYSILTGPTQVTQTATGVRFTLQIAKDAKDSLKPGTNLFLLLPGVINPTQTGAQALTVNLISPAGPRYVANTTVMLGNPPAAAPRNLQVTALNSQQVTANWDPVANADRYHLYFARVPDGHFNLAYDFRRDPNPGEEWLLQETSTVYSGQGNGGLVAGDTYYFKVRAGNEFGYGPFSEIVPVATKEITLLFADPAPGQEVSINSSLKVVFDQAIKISDPDKVQVFKKSNGAPVETNIQVDGAKLVISPLLQPATEYQVVFYGGALESVGNPGVTNPFLDWVFRTY